MSFKDLIASDIHGVFLNDSEFAERRDVYYDGEVYSNIPIVMTEIKEGARQQSSDSMQGLYLVSKILHCALSDLGGNVPERGLRIKLTEPGDYFGKTYYVRDVGIDMGMLKIGLEAVDE